MSLRLCSRAPWTTSSSAAIENAIVPRERVFVQGGRVLQRARFRVRRSDARHRPPRRRRHPRGGRDHRPCPGVVEAPPRPGAALLGLHHRGGDAAHDRVARTPPGPAPRGCRDPLHRPPGRAGGSDRLRGPAGSLPGRPRAEPERQGADRAGEGALERGQAPGARRAAEAAQSPSETQRARETARPGRGHRLRGDARHPLHTRGGRVLDLRARQGDRPRLLAPPATAPQAGPRHVGSDRREARRLRPRAAAPDRPRRHDAVAPLLGDRRAVLAARRRVRRAGRDRARDRPARGRRARGRGGLHLVGAGRAAGGRLRPRGARLARTTS